MNARNIPEKRLYSEAFAEKFALVRALCTTWTDGDGGREPMLINWMRELRDWDSRDAAELAAAWDATDQPIELVPAAKAKGKK